MLGCEKIETCVISWLGLVRVCVLWIDLILYSVKLYPRM